MKLSNLTVGYGNKAVLEDLTVELKAPIICLMGENGRGKTTLLHTLAGLLPPLKGEILEGPLKPALMFQQDRLFGWLNVLENVEIVGCNREQAFTWLKKVGLAEYASRPISELSGGMARKLALARALAYDGDLLLLDEPFKGIDDSSLEEIIRLLKETGKPMIVVSHNRKAVELLEGEVIRL